jgi:hypothetical protein
MDDDHVHNFACQWVHLFSYGYLFWKISLISWVVYYCSQLLDPKGRILSPHTHDKCTPHSPKKGKWKSIFIVQIQWFFKKKRLNDVEVHIFFPFPSLYHHNLNFFLNL